MLRGLSGDAALGRKNKAGRENSAAERAKAAKAKAAKWQQLADKIWERHPDFSIRKAAAAIANQTPADREQRKKLAEAIRQKIGKKIRS